MKRLKNSHGKIIDYLQQKGPHHFKHTQSYTHSTLCLIIHYAITLSVTFQLCNLLCKYWEIPPFQHEIEHQHIALSIFLSIYAIWLLFWRLYWSQASNKSPKLRIQTIGVLYEYCWLCNSTLVASALFCNRAIGTAPAKASLIMSGYGLAVAIDQLLWYIDLTVAIVTAGKVFPIGVSKYLVWKENSTWQRRITCTHHLWTLPMIFTIGGGKVTSQAFVLACGIIAVHVLCSRWMIPKHLEAKNEMKYLNVNLSHEVWKDLSFGFLQIKAKSSTGYIFHLLWRWYLFTAVVYLLLRAVSELKVPRLRF